MSKTLNGAIKINKYLANQMKFKIRIFKGHAPSIKEIAGQKLVRVGPP